PVDTRHLPSFPTRRSSDLHRYWEALFRYVVRVLKDENDTADVLQDTFFKIWEQRERLQHVESVKAYLFTVARNGALRFIALQQKDRKSTRLNSSHVKISYA